MISVDDIVLMLILTFFVVGFGTGIIVSFAEKCMYCGKIIFIHKVRTRFQMEFGYMFMPYHKKCYTKFAKIKENPNYVP